MKAMVLKEKNTPLVLETLPDPAPGPGEAVARVLACGAGLTVHHVRAGRVPIRYPRILGHEITGEIVAVGRDVAELRPGDPVTAYFYLTCGRCAWCRINRETLCENFGGYVGREVDGGYAEYAKLPARSFIKLPDSLDWKRFPAEIGVITDAVATPVKVIRKARVTPGDTVAVFGAGGGLGVHMLMLAAWARAKKVIAVEAMASKADACARAGADEFVDASAGGVVETLKELTRGRGVDVAIDFVCNAQTLAAATSSLGRGGRLVILGGNSEPYPLPAPQVMLNEIEVLGSRYATRQEVLDSLDLVARGQIRPMVTEKAPLEQAEAVHQRLEKGLVTGRAALVMEMNTAGNRDG